MTYIIKLRNSMGLYGTMQEINAMDIIDFVQGICGWQLSEFQIKFTRAAYDAIVNDKILIYTPPRGGSI